MLLLHASVVIERSWKEGTEQDQEHMACLAHLLERVDDGFNLERAYGTLKHLLLKTVLVGEVWRLYLSK